MAQRGVCLIVSTNEYLGLNNRASETSLDDVLQISNVFINVSKGEVAKSNDLQKAFGTSSVDDVVKEVMQDGLFPIFCC